MKSNSSNSEADVQAENNDHLNSVVDMMRFEPVHMGSIETAYKSTAPESPTPIGRKPVSNDYVVGDDVGITIPHEHCSHILATGLPQRGKDSFLASVGKNLKDEHGYSYVSVHDDGRMETPLLATPSDDPSVKESLEKFEQTPEGMPTKVFVPATNDLPDHLPSNFTQFTIGVDTLTPQLILRIAGVTGTNSLVENRVKKALDETLSNGGPISDLVSRLQESATEMELTIEQSEIEEDREHNDSTATYAVSHEIDAESALEIAADRIAQLASDDVLASPTASTNIDMETVIENREQGAALCCSFLREDQAGLKYTLMDLWLRLIYRARDENPRLPRVCLEARGLEELAPAQLQHTQYPDRVKSLRKAVQQIAVQGGSRRILLLGSANSLSRVHHPVRSNMPTQFVVQASRETIDALDRTHQLSSAQKEALETFETGVGMLIADGCLQWPIEFRPAPCGVGSADKHWRDRYGRAWGARVRRDPTDALEADWWVSLPDATVHDDGAPEVGDWYLCSQDFPAEIESMDVNCEHVDAALENRRPDGVQTDLSLIPTTERE
ncbi:hypothetical protein [Natronorubrum daqingense]|uniref:Uncharacterized protein n=1 Tax=Natronorubrum daqingense TaxID=588898 RepID=A0A1N7FXI9_9EURY|nr:hypothetical protein [Natronorubrum daqingense]APX98532.1 hypothetical protein BB347_17645 [Natronorubrum daqingense]SIS04965.1 hypothetical protein SAMN05421809_3536 [Natronorubrum daqingense]